MSKDDFGPQKDNIFEIFKNPDFGSQNGGKCEKWGVENEIFSANAEKLLRRCRSPQFQIMTRRAYNAL